MPTAHRKGQSDMTILFIFGWIENGFMFGRLRNDMRSASILTGNGFWRRLLLDMSKMLLRQFHQRIMRDSRSSDYHLLWIISNSFLIKAID
mmetsp:Transcript_97997/g.282681  ORF Transcript_97997/g.282681 Transcript_97997/m.282681 type:complete len:91 (-) Transcript_97997:128-400(-)